MTKSDGEFVPVQTSSNGALGKWRVCWNRLESRSIMGTGAREKTHARKYLRDLLKISVTVAGLGLVLRQVDLSDVFQTLLAARLPLVIISLVLVNLSLIIRAFRWSLLLRGLGVSIRFSRLVELYFVGNFFNAFLPSGFGGDVVRALEVSREIPASTAAGTVILDRLTGLTALFVMALLSFPWRPTGFPTPFSWIIVIGALVSLGGGFVLLEGSMLRRLGGRLPGPLSPTGDAPIARLLRAVQGCGWRAIWGALAVSLVFNLILSGYWSIGGLALEQRVDFSYYVLVMPLLSVPLLIPSVSGLGPRELVATFVFVPAGMTLDTALSLSLLIFTITRLSSLIGAPLYVWSTIRAGRLRRNEKPATESKPIVEMLSVNSGSGDSGVQDSAGR